MTEPKNPANTAAAAMPPATAVYALGSDPAESAPLRRQSDELRAFSAELLDRVGLEPGQSAIDLGCGPSGIIELLSGRVSPSGHVVGVDADPAHVAMARQFADERGLANVDVVAADARNTGLPSGSFDLVHTRTLLVTLPEPAAVVAEMARLARAGGWVVSLEPDTEYALCYPRHPAFDRICELFDVAFRRNGADPWIGRRVTELYREAGLDEIGVEARAALHPAGDSRSEHWAAVAQPYDGCVTGSQPPPPRGRRPEWSRPEYVIARGGEISLPAGEPVPISVVLATSATAAVEIRSVAAFPTGFEVHVVAHFVVSEDMWDPMQGLAGLRSRPGDVEGELSDEHLRFRVQFANGSEANNLGPPMARPTTPGPFLQFGPGAGEHGRAPGERSMAETTFWVWPLPPGGPVSFVCEWPKHGIPPTTHVVEAQLILDAAHRAAERWPDEMGGA